MGKTVRAARLTADLVANASPFEAGLRKASLQLQKTNTYWNQSLRGLQRNLGSAGRSVDNLGDRADALGASFRSLGNILAGAFSIQKIIAYSDIWKQTEGRLKIVSNNAVELAVNQEKIFNMAQATGQEYEGLVNLYSRLNMALPPQLKAQTDLLAVTDTFSRSLVVTGESAEAARGAIIQFSQGIASDFKSSGQELNSIIEQAPRAAQAIARYYGTTTAGLKKLAEAGQISAEGVIKGLLAEQKQITQESEALLNTVGRALTRLDNAFLRYIGQSAAAQAGTSSLAIAINGVAENFETLGDIVTVGAAVLATRYVAALALANAQSIVLAATTAATTASMLRLGVAASGSAVMVNALSISLGRLVAFLSAPLTLAAAMALLYASMKGTDGLTRAMTQAQDELNVSFEAAGGLINQYSIASGEARNKILSDLDDQIAKIEEAIQMWIELARVASQENVFFRTFREVGGMIGLEESASTMLDKAEAAAARLNDLRNRRQEVVNAPPLPKMPTGDTDASKERDREAKSILNSLERQYEQLEKQSIELQVQGRLIGATENEIKRQTDLRMLQFELDKARAVLTDEEYAKAVAISNEIAKQIDWNYDKLDALDQQKKRMEEMKKLAEEVGDAFKSGFEAAIFEGKKLRDVLGGIMKDIGQMILRKSVTEPLGNAFGSIFGKIFGGIGGSFSGGTDFVHRDMTARLHKGEAVLKPDEAEMWRNGKMGGQNTYYIDARGADQAAVMRIEGALMSLAGPGVIEKRVQNAQMRGSL